MKNVAFYMLTVLIWGSTWLGIKFQLGVVDPIVSVAYRFLLAAVILLLWCLAARLRLRFTFQAHIFMALQGAFLFAFNYWLFYVAELYIASGLAAVIFSTILVMNMINGTLLLGSPFDVKVLFGGVIGMAGICLVFKAELVSFSLSDKGLHGMLLCVAATYLASLGNILSARNQKHGLPVIQTNAFGMAYGALMMIAFAFANGKTFTFLSTPVYIGALIYLALFGSVIGFGCYLSLLGRIGADRAAYATLLFPIVALAISTIWEGYHWTASAAGGVVLILSGNLVIIVKRTAAA